MYLNLFSKLSGDFTIENFQDRFSKLKALIFDWDSCLTHTYTMEDWDKLHKQMILYGVVNKGMTEQEASSYVYSKIQTKGYAFSTLYYEKHDPCYRDFHIRTHQGIDVSHLKQTVTPLATMMLEAVKKRLPIAILSNGATCYVRRSVEASGWSHIFHPQLIFGLDRVGMPYDKSCFDGYAQVIDWMSHIYGVQLNPSDVGMVEDSRANLIPIHEKGGMAIAIDNRSFTEKLLSTTDEYYSFPCRETFSKTILTT